MLNADDRKYLQTLSARNLEFRLTWLFLMPWITMMLGSLELWAARAIGHFQGYTLRAVWTFLLTDVDPNRRYSGMLIMAEDHLKMAIVLFAATPFCAFLYLAARKQFPRMRRIANTLKLSGDL